jgi:hypothetical protein
MQNRPDALNAADYPSRIRWRTLEPPERLTLAGYVGGFVLLSLVAWWLDPDPRGYGTHEQLGLPPCTTQLLFKLPCPFCGMTTAFALMVHGHPLQAFHCQPAGAAGYLLGAAGCVVGMAVAAGGRYPAALRELAYRKSLWAVAAAGLAAAWFYKILAVL